MSASLDYELKKALHFLTKDSRWDVLTVMILHVNIRNRCWPSVGLIANLATNKNRNKATRAKDWLQKHGAFTLVPRDKRVEEELHLNGKQLVYQITGVIKACDDKTCHCGGDGKVYKYLYFKEQEMTTRSMNGDTTQQFRNVNADTTRSIPDDTLRSMNGDTRSIPIEINPNEVEESAKKSRSTAPSKIHPLVQEWINVRGLKIIDIGAPIGGTKYSAAAKRMAKWSQPPTSEEIRIAITSSKSAAYDFTWLETDIAKLRLEKANAAPAPINPAHVKIEPVPDHDAPDRELIETTITDLARRFSVKDEVQRVPPAA